MRYVETKQRSDEWFKLRLGKVTGSRIKDVVGMTASGQYLKKREDYKRELVSERIVGILGRKDVYVTPAMQWGTMNEDAARTTYMLRTRNKVTEEGFCIWQREDDNGNMKDLAVGVSTDGLVNDDGNLEVKCLESHNHLYKIIRENMQFDAEDQLVRTLPEEFKAQVQGQLMVTGRQYCDFVGYDSRVPVGLDLFALRVERDEDYIMFLEYEILQFLAEVERDFKYFLQYLPIAERVCLECGVVFVDQVSACGDCMSGNTQMTEVLQAPKYKLTGVEELLQVGKA